MTEEMIDPPRVAEPAAAFSYDDPAFKKAVADHAAETVARLLAEIDGAAHKPTEDKPQASFAEGLAMAIAQLNDQGSGRKRVAPEVLEARRTAHHRMETLILSAAASRITPRYSLRNKIYFDEMLVDPIYITSDHKQAAVEIDWPGVPNEAMLPLNEVAHDIFDAFLASIGSVVKPVAEEPLRVTAGGLVVHGRPTPARGVRDHANQPAAVGEGLRVHRGSAPGSYKETRIMGTVAAPAQQTV